MVELSSPPTYWIGFCTDGQLGLQAREDALVVELIRLGGLVETNGHDDNTSGVGGRTAPKGTSRSAGAQTSRGISPGGQINP